MTLIEEYVDTLVSEIKKDESLNGVRFLKEYSKQKIESPVTGFLAAVVIYSDEQHRCFTGRYKSGKEQRRAVLKFKLYAPSDTGGSGLAQLASKLRFAVEKADTAHLISSTEISPAQFNQNVSAVTRDVSVFMLYCSKGDYDDL